MIKQLPTPEEAADTLELAFRRAWTLLRPGTHGLDDREVVERERVAASVGVDERVMHMDVSRHYRAIRYNHITEHSFHARIGCDVGVRFGSTLEVNVEPKWASGPDGLVKCLAAAKLNLEICERAAQAQAAMLDVLESAFRGGDPTAAAARFGEGIELLEARWNADRKAFGDAWLAQTKSR